MTAGQVAIRKRCRAHPHRAAAAVVYAGPSTALIEAPVPGVSPSSMASSGPSAAAMSSAVSKSSITTAVRRSAARGYTAATLRQQCSVELPRFGGHLSASGRAIASAAATIVKSRITEAFARSAIPPLGARALRCPQDAGGGEHPATGLGQGVVDAFDNQPGCHCRPQALTRFHFRDPELCDKPLSGASRRLRQRRQQFKPVASRQPLRAGQGIPLPPHGRAR
jgi:hypothetical protein